LQPGSFGRTLQNWEQYWTNAGLDNELDGWLDRLGAVLKRWDDLPPDGELSSEDL